MNDSTPFKFELAFGADLAIGVVFVPSQVKPSLREEKAEYLVRTAYASYLKTRSSAIVKVEKIEAATYVNTLYEEM